MWSFVIYRKFVGEVGIFAVFFGRCMLLNVVFHVIGEVLLYLSVLILSCVVDFDILRFCLLCCFMCAVAVWFGLSFVFLVKFFGIFGLVCLVFEWCSHGSDAFFWTLLLRDIQDNMYILIVMYKIQKCIYSIKYIFK